MNKTIKDLFRKTCINALPAYETKKIDGVLQIVPRLYRRDDFCEFAKEAFKKGESYFYTEPVNPDNQNGPHRLCEPKYVYELKKSLSEKEFNQYFGDEAYLSMDIPEGTLNARISSDPDNPGMYIELVPEGTNTPIDLTLVEHNELTNALATFVWGDAMDERFTHKIMVDNYEQCVEALMEEEKDDLE